MLPLTQIPYSQPPIVALTHDMKALPTLLKAILPGSFLKLMIFRRQEWCSLGQVWVGWGVYVLRVGLGVPGEKQLQHCCAAVLKHFHFTVKYA